MTTAPAPSDSRQLSNRHSGSEIQRASRYCSLVSGLSCIIAAGLRLAWARNASATSARLLAGAAVLVQVAPGEQAISSTGRSRPNGRVHWWEPLTRSATCDHGRLAAAPRLRLRHATATGHWPVATAIAAWPTTPQPAPPP